MLYIDRDPHRCYPHLIVVVGFESPETLRDMPAVA
jgi:hypothetical protein